MEVPGGTKPWGEGADSRRDARAVLVGICLSCHGSGTLTLGGAVNTYCIGAGTCTRFD